MTKPDIVEIISARVELRRAGREHVGLCPFHADKRPSFTVSEEKQVFFCHGCGEGGDAIDFVMKLDGLTFPEAKRALGMTTDRPPRPTLTPGRRRAAEIAAAWVNQQRVKFNVMIAEAMERCDIADELGAFELAESFDRELVMLRGFYDALAHPRGAAEMLALRPAIEQITGGAENTL